MRGGLFATRVAGVVGSFEEVRSDEKKLFLQNYFYDEDLSGLLVSG